MFFMSAPPAKKLNKKQYFRLKEVEKLYKIIQNHNLRPTAYKKLLQLFIQIKKDERSGNKK